MIRVMLKYNTFKCGGYALIYAVFVLVILTVITSSVILLAYFNKIYFQDYVEKENQISHVNSGINLLMAGFEKPELIYKKKISLYGQINDTVVLSKYPWGLFTIIHAKSDFRNFVFEKVALSGGFYKNDTSYALYLPDKNKPLAISGKTKISGRCYLPVAGLKRATIDGRHYEGDRLLYGSIVQSNKFLPVLKQELIKCSFSNYEKILLTGDSLEIRSIADLQIDSIYNSFCDETVVLFMDSENNLLFHNLNGNMIVFSKNHVTVSRNSTLKDILLIAPTIEFEEGFKGSLQAIAIDSIIINKGCFFEYPSAIGIINNETDEFNPYIYLAGNVVFNGIVCCYGSSEPYEKTPYIRTEKKSLIQGQVYCSGYIEHKGKIVGSLCCNGFILYRPSGLYENYLLDATIDELSINEHYVGVDITGYAPEKIIKWLY